MADTAQPTLFDVIAVHCFYGCGYVVREHTPEAAHASMEEHYAQRRRNLAAQWRCDGCGKPMKQHRHQPGTSSWWCR